MEANDEAPDEPEKIETAEETEDVIQLSSKSLQEQRENATYKIRPNFLKKQVFFVTTQFDYVK